MTMTNDRRSSSAGKASTQAIVFEYCVPMLIDVVVRLSQQYGWVPVYFISNASRDLVKKHFPSAIYQETNDARFGRPAPELPDIGATAVLDQPMAEALAYAEVNALKQMDRMELLCGFSIRERFLHFHRLVNYWNAVFDRLKPDVLLMITAPHVTYDYVAYMLARHRGIRTVLFEYVTTEGLIMAIDRFEDGLPPLMAEYQRLLAHPPPGPVKLSERLEKYWQRLKEHYDRAMPEMTRAVLANANARRLAAQEAEKLAAAKAAEAVSAGTPPPVRPMMFFSHLRNALAPLRPSELMRALPSSVADAVRKTLWPPPPPVRVELPPPPPVDGHYKGVFYDLAPDDLARASAELRSRHSEGMQRRYNDLAVSPDFTQPYVYVALSMQPERATNPNGGVFDDQDLMVGLIAAALPAGWRIYVKEHPSQFIDGVRVERGRWENFYDAIVAHPNVFLVPFDTPSFDLIDHARAVASVTGTSSWEAIARGVPALLFGEAWYKGCEGAYTIRTQEDCRQALIKIAAGKRPEPDAVRLFLHAVDRTAFAGYLEVDDKALAQVDEEVNVANLARAIAQCYEAATAAAEKARGISK